MKNNIKKLIRYHKTIFKIDKLYTSHIINLVIATLVIGIVFNLINHTWIFLMFVAFPIFMHIHRYLTYYVLEFDELEKEISIEKRQKLLYNQFMKKTYQ